jgi:beta-lactamase superfamily II metal-dependent hydrolase
MLSIEMLPVEHGDSLLVTYGDPAAPHHVLIDGGPYFIYQDGTFVERKALLQRVERLATAGGQLELLVVTHIDADHIEGIVKLLGGRSGRPRIRDVWFNSWRHLAPQPDDLLGPIHGEMLSALIQHRDLPWNAAFDGGPVAAPTEDPPPAVALSGGLRLTLLSPTPAELAALCEPWEELLRKEGLDPDAPEQALERLKHHRLRPDDYLGERRPDVEQLADKPFKSDTSPANGSSIAFIAEYDGRRCLFAGDAHPHVLEASIQRLLAANADHRLRLDAFKVPHHGSSRNLSVSLLERIECRHYLLSSSGNYYGHPHLEAVARIIAHGGEQPVLHFNYRSEKSAVWDDAVLQTDYGYTTRYPDAAETGLVVSL